MRQLKPIWRSKQFKLPFQLYRVVGESMLPTLAPNTVVLAWRTCTVQVGDIVVTHHAGRDKIKRVADVREGGVYVLGDNLLGSTDSRHFGWLPSTAVSGKVVWPRRAVPTRSAVTPSS